MRPKINEAGLQVAKMTNNGHFGTKRDHFLAILSEELLCPIILFSLSRKPPFAPQYQNCADIKKIAEDLSISPKLKMALNLSKYILK